MKVFKKIARYFSESRQELKKVVWPTKAEVVSSTKIVLISTVIIAILLGVVDFVLLKGVYFFF